MADYKLLSDSQLTDLLKASNHAAYTEIYNRYYYLLFTHAFKKLRDEDQTKDVIQQIFISLWTKRAVTAFSGELANYLYTAVRYKILDGIKHQDVEKKYLNSLWNYQEHDNVIADHLIREKQLSSIIEKEIDKLPARVKETFLLSRNEHMTHAEIAEKLSITKPSVRSYTKDALKILRLRFNHLLS